MADIQFYVLHDGNRERAACRLAEKAVAQGHQVHIRTQDAQATVALNSLLWVFRDQAFLPHSVGASENPLVHVSLHENWLPEERDMLINLSDGLPEEFESFAHVAEMVGPDDESKARGRERFREYKERGIEPTHEVVKSS